MKIQPLNISDEFFHPYLRKYIDLSFHEIITKHIELERDLLHDIKKLIVFYFKLKGYEFRENIFSKEKNKLELTINYLENDRTLFISIIEMNKKQRLFPQRKDFSLFGRIKKIELKISEKIHSHAEDLMEYLVQIIHSSYTALENAVIENSEDIHAALLKRVYSIYYNKVTSSNRSHLVSKARFFIFKKNEGFFLFDKSAMIAAINHFKACSDSRHSAFEYIIMLFSNPLPFSKSLTYDAINQDNKTAETTWNHVRYQDEVKFFQAAGKLYDFEPYGVIVVCEARNYYLSVAYAKKDKRQICEEINEIKELLEEEFKKGISGYSIFIRKIKVFIPLERYKNNASIIAEVTGRAIGGLLEVLSRHPH